MDVIVESERDKLTLDWLISQVGRVAVEEACIKLSGQRRPYVSNVAKILGLEPPESIQLTSREEARSHLAAMKAMLYGCKP